MIFNSLFTQLVLAAIAVALIFVYVKPTLAQIAETRESIELYKAEQFRVSEVNQRLALLVNEVNSISPSDQKALLTYMPDKVDSASVSRDIFTMSRLANVDIKDIKSTDPQKTNSKDGNTGNADPVPHPYRVILEGRYENIKNFLFALEQNNYPLEIHELVATGKTNATDTVREDVLDVELTIVTYSRI